MAVTGLAIKLSNKFFKISARLPGGVNAPCAGASRNKVLGNKTLETTALNAAKSMPKAYISIIGLM